MALPLEGAVPLVGTIMRGKPLKIVNVVIAVVGIAMVLYQLINTQYIIQDFVLNKNTHLGFALILVFLATLRQSSKRRWLWLALALLALGATGYVHLFYMDLVARKGFSSTSDVVLALIIMILTLEATRQAFGKILPIVIAVFFAYFFLGQYLPGPLHASFYNLKYVMLKVVLDFSTGVYGLVLQASVSTIFYFILFGVLAQASGAGKFFLQLGRLISRYFRSGPALAAIVGSTLFGSVTGSPSANIVVTGSFTIPLMKRVGYRPEQAGAIEASASTIGQIMPPVMGVAAFVMAEFTNTPYIIIIGMALLPALLCGFSMAVYVQLQAVKMNISRLAEEFDAKEMLRHAPLFFVPLSIIIILLVIGYTPTFSVFWATIALIALNLVRKETRLSLTGWIQTLSDGAVFASKIAVMCAAIGIMVSAIITTGLGLKIPAVVEQLSGGNIVIALVITAFVSILLGCGVPTSAAYILVAFMVAPILIQMGIPLLAAHFFVFYFAVWSMVTPPMAPAPATASVIAGSKFWGTAVEAVKVAGVGFLIPFMFVFWPTLLLQFQSPLSAIIQLVASIVMIMSLQVGIVGQYIVDCPLPHRALSIASLVVLLMYCFTGNYVFLFAGIGGFVALTLLQLARRRALG